MKVDRRQFLAVVGTGQVAGRAVAQPDGGRASDALDELLAAHADALPEVHGAGANHDPMAAEALEALGAAARIPPNWVARAATYAGPLWRSVAVQWLEWK
ncbi:MAG: hypothetical protein FJ293_13100 [Planctomycetes bacterium]|nr:hypothetical protein [Planctomycetota bacterium]